MGHLNRRTGFGAGFTYEGAPAVRETAERQLRRAVLTCLLWEDGFYEDGETIAERIADLVPKVAPETVAALAVEARTAFKLRHVPLLLAREMLRHDGHRPLVAGVLATVVQRPDELGEFLAIYWAEGRTPLAAQAKKGLARAFGKFDAYRLAKWDRSTAAIRLRDVLRLVHAVPVDAAQAALWKQVIDGTLPVPDTWETQLSAGADKLGTWTRLLVERKLGALALLRNLRNMDRAGVYRGLVADALHDADVRRVLPYRFVAAAAHAPHMEPALEAAMLRCLEAVPTRLPGRTILLIDVSGSMTAPVAARSEVSRIDAAAGLAILAREIAEEVEVFTFSNVTVEVPARRGFALRDAIRMSQPFAGTNLGHALDAIRGRPADRLIVFTDEQSHDRPDWRHLPPVWIANVAPYRPAVARETAHVRRIEGFSEQLLAYVAAAEAEGL